MKFCCLLSFFIAFSIYGNSQNIPPAALPKLSAGLKLALAGKKASPLGFIKNKRAYLPIILQVEKNNPVADLLRRHGCFVRSYMDNIMTADILQDRIYEVAALPFVKRIELPLLLRKTDSGGDTLLQQMTTVDKVRQGIAPLDAAYTGKNVLIGIIDDGIDISHPDFYDDSNRLRVKYLWNMDHFQDTNHLPTEFDYGCEWSNAEMVSYADQFKKKAINGYGMENLFGYTFHGTSVAGLAAGKRGIAPEADIVGVALTALGDTILRSDRILDAIKYIYSKASDEHKKCIINISLGLMDGGPHDGKTLVEKAIDNFCNNHPNDVLVCVSAGNNGNTWKHWGGFPIRKDSSFCFFYVVSEGSLYFSIPKQYSSSLSLSFTDSHLGNINNPDTATSHIIGQTPFVNVAKLIDTGVLIKEEVDSARNLSATFTYSGAHYNDDYDEVIVKVNEYSSTNTTINAHLCRFIWKGQGVVHGWYPFLNLHPIYYFDVNPRPQDSTFHVSDNDYTTNIPSNAYTVLSSGAYNLRSCYVNMKQQAVNGYERCRTTYFTSHGPTLDGRTKPDIISPGEDVFTSRSRFDTYYDFNFIVDTNTVSFGGTSASSPINAGIAALMWQKSPQLTRQQLIDSMKATAHFDSFSAAWGSRPNNIAGYGKVDAFKLLTGQGTNIDSLCSVYDVCNSALPPPITDEPVPLPELEAFLQPNPAQSFTYIRYRSIYPVNMIVFDSRGRAVMKKALQVSENFRYENINVSTWASGMYFFKISTPHKTILRKLIVVR